MIELFELEKQEYELGGKVVPLSEAISKSIRPGMSIHINTGALANSAIREIIREYWGKAPKFTLISSGVSFPFEIGFTCSGLVKKVITTNHSYTFPTSRPIPLLQKMHQEGLIEIESWSLYSLEQRLMAAALDVGFMPTKSLMGSSLGEENADAFKVTSNPFDEDEKIGVVKALAPDISLIHGCLADSQGNVILSPPYFTSIWGPRASKGGVIVTVEKIVSTDVIRRCSALVKLPGHMVKYVCLVPFGAHPQGLATESIDVGEGYGEDYEFIRSFVSASKDSESLMEWLEECVIKCPTQDDYLRRLGADKISFLRGRSSADAWKYDLSESAPDLKARPGFNPTEMMVVAAAREISSVVSARGYQTMLAGIGSPGLAAWLAFYLLKKGNEHIDMLTGLGLVGYAPRPGDPFLMNLPNVMTCTMLTDTVEVYGTLVGGANNRCISVLGTAQIDKYGNINTVKIGDTPFIGLGGAGDAVNARETVIVAKQSRKRFLEKVSFVGCSGQGIKTLVTDLGVFKKLGDDETFTLTKYFSTPSPGGKKERLREISDRCGWTVKSAEVLEEVLPPTAEELVMLRALDPRGFFIGK